MLHEDGKQYSGKKLWEAIKPIANNIKFKTVEILTKSMN